jgi:hypothetical protein
MTDASPNQVQSNVVSMATSIKQAGVTIIVMAVGPAASITTLQGTNVASDPSLYFSAADYQTLVDNAITTVGGMLANSCGQTSTPTYDLTVKLNSANCGNVSYTVSNPWRANFFGQLSTSFYDGNPSLPTSLLLATDVRSGQSINANGGTQTYSFTNPALAGKLKLWAVVNLDTSGVKAIAPLPTDLTSRLLLTAEQNPYNNVSDSVNATGCIATSPRLEVSMKKITIGCDKQVTYMVDICNTGGVDAAQINTQLIPANSNFILKSADGPIRTTGTASLADPNTNTATSGYRSYGVTVFPCAVTGTSDNCNFNLVYTGSGGFFATYAGFSFPPTSPGSGIPAGSTIINATLNAIVVTGNIYGAKLTDAGRFSAARTVPYVLEHFRSTATVPFTSVSTSTATTLDVTTIAQEIVNQPGWTSSSAMALLWLGARAAFQDSILNSPTTVPTLTVTYTNPTLPSGKCATYTYVYDASAAPAGTYDMSATVSTTTPGAIYLPDVNFTTNATSGLNGYNGALHTGDDAVIPTSTGCVQTPQPISTSVSITPGSTCGGPGNYVTATITINNPNTLPAPGIALNNLLQTLNLYGAGASFSGEPYGLTNGLQLATPNTLDSVYPAVNYAISNTTGAQSLFIRQLPVGTSTFKVDLIPGFAPFNLSSTISQIPTIYNAEGGTSGRNATNITTAPRPTIVWNCPGAIAAGSTINLSATVTGATAVTLTSATGGNIANTGTVTAPAATYTPTPQDIANRYAALNVYAITTNGCDSGATCTVPISGVTYDYGDAPASYDLDSNAVGTAAGSTIRSGLNLGILAPSTETTTHASAAADGDGAEEDGLISQVPIFNGITATYQVRVTNNTASVAYLAGFADFNADGNLLDSNELSGVVTIPANSGVAIYNVVFSNIPPTGIINYFMRLRLSTSATTVAKPYGASPEGEVEDYQLAFIFPLPVGLSSFTVAQQQCDVIASWEVANTSSTTRFGLERSADGQQYKETGSLKPLGDKTSYILKDKPGSGSWYYRLKMESTGGTMTYSNSMLTIVSCDEEDIRVYPTATSDLVQIVLPRIYDQASISVIDRMGSTVAVPMTGAGMNRQVQLGILPSGPYLIRIKDSRQVRIFKVIRL